VVSFLLAEGLLEVRVGLGTVVAPRPSSTASERSRLLVKEVEQLVVEAKRLGLGLTEVQSAVESHWDRLTDTTEEIAGAKKRS
jgi:GntR family transcriptional regulator